MPIDEVTSSRLPAALAGVSMRTLLGWAREPGLAPSPEVREALRNPSVLEALRELAARSHELERLDGKVIA